MSKVPRLPHLHFGKGTKFFFFSSFLSLSSSLLAPSPPHSANTSSFLLSSCLLAFSSFGNWRGRELGFLLPLFLLPLFLPPPPPPITAVTLSSFLPLYFLLPHISPYFFLSCGAKSSVRKEVWKKNILDEMERKKNTHTMQSKKYTPFGGCCSKNLQVQRKTHQLFFPPSCPSLPPRQSCPSLSLSFLVAAVTFSSERKTFFLRGRGGGRRVFREGGGSEWRERERERPVHPHTHNAAGHHHRTISLSLSVSLLPKNPRAEGRRKEGAFLHTIILFLSLGVGGG